MTPNRLYTGLAFVGCIAFLVGSLGCSDDGNNSVIESTYMNTPRATGMYYTDETGSIIGSWGVVPPLPHSSGGLPVNFATYSFPNPFKDQTNVILQLPVQSRVQIWVTRALGPNDSEEELADYFGGELVTAPGIPLWSYDDTLYAGIHVATIATHTWPKGFYCCHLQADDYYYQQVFIVKGGIPGGLPR